MRSGIVRAAILGLILFAQLATSIAFGGIQHTSAQSTPTVAVAPNRFIVTLKSDSSEDVVSAADEYDGETGVTIDQVYQSALNGFAGTFTASAITKLESDSRVASISPDFIVHSSDTVPTGIDRIDADLNPTIAGNGTGSVNVDVAVIDSGVYQDTDLNVVGGKDCIYGTNPYSDVEGHGTHVAGTIGARDNGSGVVGVAPGARIWSVKVLGNDGSGTISSVVCGLDYVASKSGTIEVVNMSLGGATGPLGNSCGSDPQHFAICKLVDLGITVVVAAGNDGEDAANYAPAQYNEVITVSAITDSDGKQGGLGECFNTSEGPYCDDEFAGFSNWGADVDIAAPGVFILSTAPFNLTAVLSGTSMATPHVAGGAALIYSQQGRMSPAKIKARLLLTAEPGAIVGDPDSSHEPELNVAMLGAGKLVAPASAQVGQDLQFRVGDFTPGSRVTFRFNGVYIGGDYADANGRASRHYLVPAMISGPYAVTADNTRKSVKATVKITPLMTVSPASGAVDTAITIKLRGFASKESVVVKINTGSSTATLATVQTSSSGSVDVHSTLPASTDGKHKITGVGTKGSSTSVNVTTNPGVSISDGSISASQHPRITIRGYGGGENVTVRFDSQSGTVLGTVTASATGSASIVVGLPVPVTNGTHYYWVMGDDGNRLRITISVSGAAEDAPEPTATMTLVPTVTATATAVSESTATATAIATETATATVEVPTATETATEIVPTATETVEPPTVEASPAD